MSAARVKLAILASGSGSNAEVLCRNFAASPVAEIAVVGCNRPEVRAGVYGRLRPLGIEVERIQASELADGTLGHRWKQGGVQGVVLAGFLLHVPDAFLAQFPGRVLNIHPALLPDFGGQGMYGMHVHEAVHAAVQREGLRESGMTVHRVNGEYDRGEILFQARTPLTPTDTPDAIAAKVLELEHAHYPTAVEREVATWRM